MSEVNGIEMRMARDGRTMDCGHAVPDVCMTEDPSRGSRDNIPCRVCPDCLALGTVKKVKLSRTGPWHLVNTEGPSADYLPCGCGLIHSVYGDGTVITIRPYPITPEQEKAYNRLMTEGA